MFLQAQLKTTVTYICDILQTGVDNLKKRWDPRLSHVP
jgi:hypothetical protein